MRKPHTSTPLNRRAFVSCLGSALAAGLSAPLLLRGAAAADPMKRIGMSSVTFRARFAQTRIKGHPPIPELKLLDLPEYYADRFKIHQIEFWSRHFESQEPAYLKELKDRVARAKSVLINVQIDEPYNLANADDAARQKSVALFKSWVDTAVALGSQAIRANTGQGDFDACVRSFKELDTYTRSKGILFLVENHGGLSSDPQKLVDVVQAVGSPNLEILPDFGNFPAPVRLEGLKAILPFAKHLISAKTHAFDAEGRHSDFDFDQCVRMAQAAGFPGIYSAEYFDRHGQGVDYEKIADWMIERLKANLGRV